MVRGATRPRRDDGGAVPGEAGNAMEAGDVDNFGEGQIGQDRVSWCTGIMARSSCAWGSDEEVWAAHHHRHASSHTDPRVGLKRCTMPISLAQQRSDGLQLLGICLDR
jgi:hypothetical protein